MKIGILTYHSVYNFGANLQAISTYGYFKKKGNDVCIIDWIPEDLENYYKKITPADQQKMHDEFLYSNASITELCRTNEDVARVIEKNNITHVVIGSDAVAQHHPFLSKIIFPSKKVISIYKPLSDRIFPNPFWGCFSSYLKNPIKIAMMSASGQTTKIKTIQGKTKKSMAEAIKKISFISVRDNHTKNLIEHISNKSVIPRISPDPVFNFNDNFIGKEVSKDEIIKKFNLPEHYVLLSFKDNVTVNSNWINNIKQLFADKDIASVALAFPSGVKFENNLEHKIDIPINPLDWYYLIKYSQGYVGHNMHPIIVALHNAVPFYSFDHYVKRSNFFWVNEKTSKIHHIVNKAKLNSNRISVLYGVTKIPNEITVFKAIMNFEKEKCKKFSENQTQEYNQMMHDLINTFK